MPSCFIAISFVKWTCNFSSRVHGYHRSRRIMLVVCVWPVSLCQAIKLGVSIPGMIWLSIFIVEYAMCFSLLCCLASWTSPDLISQNCPNRSVFSPAHADFWETQRIAIATLTPRYGSLPESSEVWKWSSAAASETPKATSMSAAVEVGHHHPLTQRHATSKTTVDVCLVRCHPSESNYQLQCSIVTAELFRPYFLRRIGTMRTYPPTSLNFPLQHL